jgi:ABC transport system ATP-binding/permease protein
MHDQSKLEYSRQYSESDPRVTYFTPRLAIHKRFPGDSSRPGTRAWVHRDMSAVFSSRSVSLSYGAQNVLDESVLVVHEGDRVGLLGRNGSGKSTFLKIVAGVMEPDSGEIVRRRDLLTGYLPQVFDLDGERTVHANILEGARRILEWIAEYESAPPSSSRAADLLGWIDHANGWELEHRIKSLITHLHAPEPDRLVRDLSGGEKRRVALCRALVEQPDFLILDEPTNHLDTESITWLEDFLRRYPGACLFVTHDRYFLDRVATRIVELARGKFTEYDGSYTDYLAARAERAATEDLQEHKRQRFLKRELEWVRRGPKARRTKSRDRIDRYYKIAEEDGPEKELDVELLIPPAPKLANRVVDLLDVTARVGERTLFSGLTFKLAAGERIGIVGRNGLGKTTLLRLILGEIQPAAGQVEIGARTEINYVDQSKLLLDDEKTVYQEAGGGSEWVKLGEESISLRAWLRRFLFTEDRLNTKVRLLSGGERGRLMLAKILRRGGNLLILDEPTNDLDLATLRVLEEALATFGGSVLAVSHDRYFLNRICTGILAFEGNEQVRYYVGSYDYYLEMRERGEAELAAPAPAKSSPAIQAAPAAKPRKLKWKEEKELETIEQTILAAETEVARLNAMIAEPDFFEKHGGDYQTQQANLDAAHKRVARLYERWTELEGIKTGQAG